MGLAVSAWIDGIRSVTQKPYLSPVGAELTRLLALFDDPSTPRPEAGRVEWARQKGAAFARDNLGRRMNVFAFVDWMVSPQAPSNDPVRAAADARERRQALDREVEQRARAAQGGDG